MTETTSQTQPEEKPSKEVVKVDVPLDKPLANLDQAWRLASAVALADILPNDIRGKPSNALTIMLYGRDLGMSPVQSFQAIYIVNGKPQLSADSWTALAKRAGHKVRWLESTAEKATVQIVLKDDPDYPHEETFTIEEAIAAGLCARDKDGNITARDKYGNAKPWEAWTKRMLRNRAISFAGKSACPEVALGFGIEGDYDDIPSAGVTVTPVQRPDNEQPPSQADLQAAVIQAQSAFNNPGDDGPPDAVDAEIVPDDPTPDPPAAASSDEASRGRRARPKNPPVTEPAVDEDAAQFARLDEQHRREQAAQQERNETGDD